MNHILQSFFLLLATATDRQLAKYVEYLKAENRILRDHLPKRIHLTNRERNRLIRFGKPLGSAIRNLIAIVTPRTFMRWITTKKSKQPKKGPGRPRKEVDVRKLVLSIAKETGWGYTRILGELKKLGICSISRSTVVNILKTAGVDPGPNRGAGSWHDFLKRHSSTLWACDFFTKKVWTMRGPIDLFVLFFIHHGTRRVHIGGSTAHPNAAWMVDRAKEFSKICRQRCPNNMILLRDMDTKFTCQFDDILNSEGIEVRRVGPRSPNMNAIAERWVQSVQQECLDYFYVFGERHLRHIVDEYVDHFNQERPHQSLGNRVPFPTENSTGPWNGARRVECHHRLGGLLKHNRLAA